MSDNDNRGEVNPEDTPQGNYFYEKTNLIWRRQSEEEMTIIIWKKR